MNSFIAYDTITSHLFPKYIKERSISKNNITRQKVIFTKFPSKSFRNRSSERKKQCPPSNVQTIDKKNIQSPHKKSIQINDTTAVEVVPTKKKENFIDTDHSKHKKHVEEEGKATYNQSLFNAVNMLMGVGLLSIPYALKEGGWASLGVLALVWCSTNYTGKILIRCQEVYRNKKKLIDIEDIAPEVNKVNIQKKNNPIQVVGRLLKSYEDIGEACFGKIGRNFITTVLYAELIGTCTLFFILEGDHLHFLLSELMKPGMYIPSTDELMMLSAAVFIPTAWLPDLRALSYIGALGILASLGLTGVVGYQFINGGLNFADTIPADFASLPTAFGMLAFVFAGHAVFPSIYVEMKDKSKYEKMLDHTYLIVGAACLVMGVAGYLSYGNSTAEEITMNLPAGILTFASAGFMLITPFAKFALTLEPVARGIESKLGLSTKGPTSYLTKLNRTCLGLGALTLAMNVPFFGEFMSIVGSFLTLTVSAIFPAACYIKLYGTKMTSSEKALNCAIMGIGAMFATSGTITAIKHVMNQLN